MTRFTVQMIPVDKITVTHPRERSQRAFGALRDNIFDVGLKRPIAVSPRADDSGDVSYTLVYGQGRLDAFKLLGQREIPAIVRYVSDIDSTVMSLVGNDARRHRGPLDLVADISRLRKAYGEAEVARKVGSEPQYIHGIGELLDRKEQRLVAAVVAGILPLAFALEIARARASAIPRILAKARRAKVLRGKRLAAVRRILQRRARSGPDVTGRIYGRKQPAPKVDSTTTAMKAFGREATKQKAMVRRGRLAKTLLAAACRAFAVLVADQNFLNLLRAEGIASIPSYLAATPTEAFSNAR